ncbi:TolC family protein [Telmatobacter bradus]|uniref:TolC family protein n=1 Tax=Telmatobacter bradus TaxID=474953 RepID=UPI003B43270E
MRNQILSFLLLSSTLILEAACSPLASAQSVGTTNDRKITLAEVIDFARKNYPAIQAAQAETRAANGQVGVARTVYLPRTDLLWQTNRATANNIYGLLLPQGVISTISGPVIASDPSRSAWSSGGGMLMSWQPFDFGARRAKIDIALQGSAAAKQTAALTTLEVTANAASAFFDLAAAQQLVKVAQANVERNESFNKAVHVLVDNTLRPGADASQANAQLALARNQLIQAETEASIRRLALAKYLPDGDKEVEIDVSQMLAVLPLAELASTLPTSHPAVLEEDARVHQQEAQKHLLDRSYVPSFSTLAAVSGRGAGTDASGHFPGGTAGLAPDTFNWAAGFQVTFSAFDFFGIREQKKVQASNVQAEEARYNQSLDDVSAAIAQARARLTGARQIAANTPVELSAAQANEQQQQARYRSGLATVVDVAASEGVLAQAQADDAIARLSVWRAELGVAAAQGDIQPFLQTIQSHTEGR